MQRLRLAASLVATGVLPFGLSGCTRWMQIDGASATSSASTHLRLSLEGCAPSPPPTRVVESDTAIHVLFRLKIRDEQLACLSSVTVDLAKPVGTRKVIDDDNGSRLKVNFALAVPLPDPSWLPDGWRSFVESGNDGFGTVSFGPDKTSPAVQLTLATATSGAVERFRGAPTVGTTTIQGRAAAWIEPPDHPGTSGVLMQDDRWLLVLEAWDPSVDHATIEHIAESLQPLPFAADASASPTVAP